MYVRYVCYVCMYVGDRDLRGRVCESPAAAQRGDDSGGRVHLRHARRHHEEVRVTVVMYVLYYVCMYVS